MLSWGCGCGGGGACGIKDFVVFSDDNMAAANCFCCCSILAAVFSTSLNGISVLGSERGEALVGSDLLSALLLL